MLEIIRSRRSVRRFKKSPVNDESIMKLLEAARWAPSGLNNQPWKFAVVSESGLKQQMSGLTRYSTVVKGAQVLISVFLDSETMYDRTKDVQAVGACIQNMLLQAHSLGLGAVWLGEIIKSGGEIKRILGLGEELELMAVLAIGYPDEKPRPGKRKPLKDLVVLKR